MTCWKLALALRPFGQVVKVLGLGSLGAGSYTYDPALAVSNMERLGMGMDPSRGDHNGMHR